MFRNYCPVILLAVLLVYLISLQVPVQAAVHRDPPLLVYLERGMNLYQDDVQQIDEDQQLSGEWSLAGYFRLLSKSAEPHGDQGYTAWDGIAASFPESGADFSAIKFRVVRRWKGPSEEFSQVLLETDLSPGPGRTLRKMDASELDGIEESRDYAFTVDLGAMSIDFPMPLECSDPGLFLYRVQVEMEFEKAVWDQAGANHSSSRQVKIVSDRAVLVADRTPPQIILGTGLPPSGTTGDPLDPSCLILSLLDNNPNQEIENAYIQIPSGSARSYTLYDDSSDLQPQRFHPPDSPRGMDERFVLENIRVDLPGRGGKDEVVRMPEDGTPLEYDIIVKPLFGPGEVMHGSLENQDNDPPDVTFKIAESPDALEDSGVTISVCGGVYDPLDQDTFGKVDIIGPGSSHRSFQFREPEGRVCQIDLASVMGNDLPSIAEDQRIYFKASAQDNVDGEVPVELQGRHFPAGRNTGALILREPGRISFSIQARDKAGNVMEALFALEVVDTRVTRATLGSGN